MSAVCAGCKDNRYNYSNDQGVKECMYKKYIKRGKCSMRSVAKGIPYK